MVDAEGIEEVRRNVTWPGFCCRVLHITLVSFMLALCDIRKPYLSRLMPSAYIACLSLHQM